MLFRAATDRSDVLFGLGMTLLTLALNVRAGAFFVLPFLLFWGWVGLKIRPKMSWRSVLFGMVGTAIGFAVPILFLKGWGHGHSPMMSNFATTLYGMATGNGGWQIIYHDHPEIFQQSGEQDQTSAAYNAAINLIIDHPFLIIKFYFNEISRFFDFAINFLDLRKYWLPDVFGVFLVVGLITALLRVRDACGGLLTALMVGMALSLPFLMVDGGTRVFAATAPAMILTAVLGLTIMARVLTAALTGRRLGSRMVGLRCRIHKSFPLSGLVAVIAVVVVAIGPVIVVALRDRTVPM